MRGMGVTERCRRVGHRKAWARSWGLEQDPHGGRILGVWLWGRSARAAGSGVSASLCSAAGGCRALQAHSSVRSSAAGGWAPVWADAAGTSWALPLNFPLCNRGRGRRLNRQAVCCFVTFARAVGTSVSLAKLFQHMWESFGADLVPVPCYLKPPCKR